MNNEIAAAMLASELAKIAAELIEANIAKDTERERQAILKANRLTSDELARREANS